MGNCIHEIMKEENDLRLHLIELHNGICPICKNNVVVELFDGYDIDKPPDTEKYIYHCIKCGIIARREREAGYYKYIKCQNDITNLLINILYH